MQRTLSRQRLDGFVALVVLATSGLVASARAADAPRVSIGEVMVAPDASGGEPARELTRALRSTVNDELAKTAGLSRMKHPVIVSVTLTKLSSEAHEQRIKTSAVISLALRRADDQVLFAELRGRATVEEATKNLASLRQRAVEGAVRGALARLPEAIAQAR